MRYLGIDWGSKYVGIAISDKEGLFSFPYDVLKNDDEHLLEVKIYEILKKNRITNVIIGLPLTLKGNESESSKKVREFVEKLRKNEKFSSITFEFFDERLTTKLVEKELLTLKKKREEKKAIINKATAQKILQDYLDFKRLQGYS